MVSDDHSNYRYAVFCVESISDLAAMPVAICLSAYLVE